MKQLKELTIKKIRQSKSTSDIQMLIDKEVLKLSKSKVEESVIPKFLKEFIADLLKINAMEVSSDEWENIKKARLHLIFLIKSVAA